MKYVLYGFTLLYVVANMAAVGAALKKGGQNMTACMMAFGAAILACATFIQPGAWAFAAVGGLLICAAAFINGKRSGNFHLSHHIVRFCITAAIVVGYIVLK